MSSKRLGAQGLHPQCQAGKHRVTGDVSEGDGEGAGGKLAVAKIAEEEHGEDGARVENESGESYWEGEVKERFGFGGDLGEGWTNELRMLYGVGFGILQLLHTVG